MPVPNSSGAWNRNSPSLQYVNKLVAIGSDDDQLVLNREAALGAAANVADVLSDDNKRASLPTCATTGGAANSSSPQ